jgi:hypothetical protein
MEDVPAVFCVRLVLRDEEAAELSIGDYVSRKFHSVSVGSLSEGLDGYP